MQKNILRHSLKNLLKISWITFSVVGVAILVFLSEWIQKAGIISFPLGFRHMAILVLFLINWVIFGRPIILNKFYIFNIILIIIYLILARIFVPVKLFNYILGTGFTFLFIGLFVLGSNTKSDLNVVIKILKILLLFFLIMSIGPIIQGLLAHTSLRRLPGMFRELGAFGSAMNIGVVLTFSLYVMTGEKKYIFYAVFLSFGVFLTILKKSMLGNIIIWLVFAYYYLSSRNRIKLLLYGIFFLLISFAFVGDNVKKDVKLNIDYYNRVGPKGHVRVAMYVASYKIAKDFFPFGSGMGTFASLASIIGGYSKVHIDYGVSEIGGNSPIIVARGGHTLLDTYWPHILAELGFIGATIFLLLWFFPLISSIHLMRLCNDSTIRGLCFYIILITIVMTNDGFTLYNPEIPSFVLLHSGVTGLCYYHINKYRTNITK